MEDILIRKERILRILFCDTDERLLFAILKHLELFMNYAGFKSVVLYTTFLNKDVEHYCKEHSFFQYKIVDNRYLEKKSEHAVIFPRIGQIIVHASTNYSNNVLKLVGRNNISVDEIVLIGLFGIPEVYLSDKGNA